MTYLYIYANAKRRKVYIGVGEDSLRIFGPHNADAKKLLDDPTTELLQTPERFTRREDAERAEATAIYVANLLGAEVISDLTEDDKPVTNRSGVLSTKHLVPSVERKEGSVSYWALQRTAIVTLTTRAIDERGTLHAGRDAATFATRASGLWPLRSAEKRGDRPKRLLAVQKSSHIIYGHWRLDEDAPFVLGSPKNDRFRMVDPLEDNVDDCKGKQFEWDGRGVGTLLTWSQDLG